MALAALVTQVLVSGSALAGSKGERLTESAFISLETSGVEGFCSAGFLPWKKGQRAIEPGDVLMPCIVVFSLCGRLLFARFLFW